MPRTCLRIFVSVKVPKLCFDSVVKKNKKGIPKSISNKFCLVSALNIRIGMIRTKRYSEWRDEEAQSSVVCATEVGVVEAK